MGQPQKKSKRARKQKDKNSLRQKRIPAKSCDSTSNQQDFSHEINRAYEGNDDLGLTLLPKKSSNAHEGQEDTHLPLPAKLTKAKSRKAAQVARAKVVKQQRAEVLASLAETELPPQTARLLHHSADRGQRPTKRQRLRRDLLAHRLGVDLQEHAVKGPGLHQDRIVPGGNGSRLAASADGPNAGDTSDDGSDSDGSECDNPVQPNDRQQQIPGNASIGATASGSICNRPPTGETAHQAASPAATMSASQQREAIQALRQSMGLGDEPERVASSLQQSGGQGGPPRVVPVTRAAAIAESRESLPIVAMEQEVMEAISSSDIVLLCGETGCGKTTQVPQFLYEAGYGSALFPERSGRIGVTQPRRVAATSTAQRVAEELGSSVGQTVGYQVRYDRAVGTNTAIKFMTDGILMREVQEDFLLRQYSVLVIDEAHERSLNTDLLLGMLSRAVPLRRKLADQGSGQPLKLVIMSATLRLEDFADNRQLFPEVPPVVRVPARQHPVTVHFARRTELEDYVGAAFKKVKQIHRGLPPGGILVFLTGQREVEELCRKLRWFLGPQAAKRTADVARARANAAAEVSQGVPRGAAIGVELQHEAEANDAEWFGADAAERDSDFPSVITGGGGNDEGEVVSEEELMESDDDEEETLTLGASGFSPEQLREAEAHWQKELGASLAAASDSEQAVPVHVLPLYAALPASQQSRVFRPTPQDHRFIVVATNVAETSLTIPGIRYVVDAGRSKQRVIDSHAGLARFQVAWISQSGAAQRAGRSGRTGPGHCYRLFSSAVFNDSFPLHGAPEIATTSLEGVVLTMKSLSIDRVSNFPFPSPPPAEALKVAARCLEALGALDPHTARLTDIGRAMARLPISPRHSRMLVQARGEDTKAKSRTHSLPYAILLGAVLSVESPFLHSEHFTGGSHGAEVAKQEAAKQKQRLRVAHGKLRHPGGDALSSLNALCAFIAAGAAGEAFCRESFLAHRPLKEALALAHQLHRILTAQPDSKHLLRPPDRRKPGKHAQLSPQQLPDEPPQPSVARRLQRALTAGWADQIALRKTSEARLQTEEEARDKGASRAVRYSSALSSSEVFLHPRSSLVHTAPRMCIYTELLKGEKRTYMTGATSIDASWLQELSAPLCTLSAPLQDPPPQFSPAEDAVLCWHDVLFSNAGWQLPRCQRIHPDATVRSTYFAGALLSGKLLTAWAPVVPALLCPAATITQVQARHIPRVGDLTAALSDNQVDSLATLAAVWSSQPTFLKREMQLWVHRGSHALLNDIWPRLVAEASTVLEP